MKGILFYCILVFNVVSIVYGYKVCGDDAKNDEIDVAVDEIVRRLMALRAPNWNWETSSSAISLQVAAPKKFFGMDKTAKQLEEMITLEWDYLSIYDLAQAGFSARAMCLNPRDLGGKDILDIVHHSLFQFLKNETTLPATHVGEFLMTLSALCINDYKIDPFIIEKVLEAQNKTTGTFGPPEDATDITIWILRPVWCLSQMQNVSFNVTDVYRAVMRMREFIISKVDKTPSGKVYIGDDEIMSNDALIGLWKSRQPNEKSSRWYCHDVMDTLGIHPLPEDNEEDLIDRLLRITGTDFLDLQPSSYNCIQPDPIPDGYKPTCNYEKPETCGIVPK